MQELHRLNIVYRDLKPEHVLIDTNGHCKLVDFGLSAILKSSSNSSNSKCFTNCGTPEYVAPEVLKEIGTRYEADIWSLGVLIHELITGETPFHHEDPTQVYENVLHCKAKYAATINKPQKELLEQIFVADPCFRLTLEQIKKFELVFTSIDWSQAAQRKLNAPWIPEEDAPYHNCTRAQQMTVSKRKS